MAKLKINKSNKSMVTLILIICNLSIPPPLVELINVIQPWLLSTCFSNPLNTTLLTHCNLIITTWPTLWFSCFSPSSPWWPSSTTPKTTRAAPTSEGSGSPSSTWGTVRCGPTDHHPISEISHFELFVLIIWGWVCFSEDTVLLRGWTLFAED